MVYAVLRRALNLAVKHDLVVRNVCVTVDRPRCTPREMQPLTQAEAKRFLKEAQEDRLHALYVLAVMIGMRQGELFGLEWNDIEFKERTLFVRRTLNELHGKFVSGPPKTKRGTRRIWLPQMTVDALCKHQARMVKEGHGSVERVFGDQKAGPLRRQNVQRRSFKPLLKAAKCPEVRFHDLRHTYATLALANGVPIRVVADTLGHSDAQVGRESVAHPTQTPHPSHPQPTVPAPAARGRRRPSSPTSANLKSSPATRLT